MHRLHIRVVGSVQGVGFRHYVVREARTLALAGVVRNLPDGSVEIDTEGDHATLERLVESVRRGPPSSRVREVETRWAEGPPRFDGFHIGL
jgi:acylphosphatase